MKKIFLLLACFAGMALTACGGNDNDPVTPPGGGTGGGSTTDSTATDTAFVRGVDISWYTEMAADGVRFYDVRGNATECVQLMKDLGMQAVRLRVWVNPQNKGCAYSDKADVVAKAVRARQLGLRVMIDFHYSDWWADPSRQDMPADWAGLSYAEVKAAIAAHTTDVLTALRDAGVEPEWVQVGNETRNGMVHPHGRLWTNTTAATAATWRNFAGLFNAGADAAKAVFPDVKVLCHLNHACEDNLWWVDAFVAAGARFDIFGLSHYPQADDPTKTWQQMNELAARHMAALTARCGKPLMVCEVGVKAATPTLGKQILADFIAKCKATGRCLGAFYWEPQAYGNWRPASYDAYGWTDAYDQGAFTPDGRPSVILDALR